MQKMQDKYPFLSKAEKMHNKNIQKNKRPGKII